jgi:quinolinate synthase
MPIAGIYGREDFAGAVHGTPAVLTAGRGAVIERAQALPMPSLEWTPEVERATAHLYQRVKNVISPVEWPLMAP